MRILMLAPHVFFQARGTPLSVYYRAKALGELGHRVDVLTYHLGEPVDCKNVRIIRAPKVPLITTLKPGPSVKKIFLDAAMVARLTWQLLVRRYDIIYTHEEAALFGAVARTTTGIPHVYDMHSSMPLQLKDWEFSDARWLRRIFDAMERFIIRNSDVVVPICKNLEDIARRIAPRAAIVTVENTAVLADEPAPDRRRAQQLRQTLGLAGKNVILYTGTFLKIQGLDLLLECVPTVIKACPQAMFVLVGGSENEIRLLRTTCARLGIERNVLLLPQYPQDDMPSFYALADILVSPRQIGINAPLKLFSYLNAAKPVVMTDLPIHRQIVQEPDAILVEPAPAAWSKTLVILLKDARLRTEKGERGRALVARRYSYAQYKQRIDMAVTRARAATSR